MIKKLLTATALAALVFSFQGCAGQKIIQSGRWVAGTDFGTLEFVVAPGGNSIMEIKFIFSNWHGSSGSITVNKPSGWPITNREFTIEYDLASGWISEDTYIVSGDFANNGEEADGAWEEILNGTHYSGKWEAEHSGSSSSLF